MTAVGRHPDHSSTEDSVGDLVSRASQQISELVRKEVQPARAEMTQKGKRSSAGGGLFGGAVLVGFLAAQALVAAVVAALALILAALLAAVAAAMAAVGKKQIAKAGTPSPEQAIDSVKADMAEIKEAAHR
ncbi:phage holin family protein [Streptomyces avidinii]|uniref:phage holin family protein n=1 Tax=Streptomyces avidinii TaxID=1895 RepID=UPI003868B9B7|nr:phage holin family protein [Streptomyces avidinii]